MLSDQVLTELVRSSPLREELLQTAWPSLSTESKLEVIDAVAPRRSASHLPDFLLDLALSDPEPIVRFWAARSYYFREHRTGPDGKELPSIPGFETSPEEFQRTARAEGDRSPLVRAATSAVRGLGLMDLIDLSQLERLIKIRTRGHPDTEGVATFVEKGLSQGLPTNDIRDCLWEYLAREDVLTEVLELDRDGMTEFAKQRGWERLWALAASAPIEVGAPIAGRAPLQGKYWKIKLETLTALPDLLKRTVMARDEEPAESLREAVAASPEKFGKDLADVPRKYHEARAEFGFSEATRAKHRLDTMPNRQDAIFELVNELKAQSEHQAEAMAALAKQDDVTRATQRILNWVIGVAIILGLVFLYLRPHYYR